MALIPDTDSFWTTAPDAEEIAVAEPEIGPPASQPSPWLVVAEEPVTTPVSVMFPAPALTDVALPVTAPVRLMEPVAPLTETALPASTPSLTTAPVAADTVVDVPARTAKRDTVPFAALTSSYDHRAGSRASLACEATQWRNSAQSARRGGACS